MPQCVRRSPSAQTQRAGAVRRGGRPAGLACAPPPGAIKASPPAATSQAARPVAWRSPFTASSCCSLRHGPRDLPLPFWLLLLLPCGV
uniref:metallothionein-3 isoform X1 n=1 Tax=Macaca mulatta TaxID=9544 RepID=UPI0010A2A44D|nr:metallothionein-3 isoform X1 [Macaca mulatta]